MADTTDTASVLDLPGARDAINYLTQRFADFQRVPSRLAAVMQTLTNAKRIAETKGMNGTATNAANLINTAQGIQSQYAPAAAAAGDLMDQLRTSGLLAGTLDTVMSAINAASQMAGILTQTDQLEQQTASVVGSSMTPEEQAKYATVGTGSLAKTLLLGAGLVAAIWAFTRGRGTRRF